MTRRLLAVVLSACWISSVTVLAQNPGQVATRAQAITLELSIVDLTDAQPDQIDKMIRASEELRRLMSESKAKVVARLHMRTRLGEGFSARVGQRGPIQSAVLTFPTTEQMRRNNGERVESPRFGFPQIEYETTGGLIVEGSTAAAGDDKFDIRLKIEITALDQSTGRLTPTIQLWTLSDIVRMKDGETAMVMGLIQQEPPWSLPAQNTPAGVSLSRSNFVVLVTAKSIQ